MILELLHTRKSNFSGRFIKHLRESLADRAPIITFKMSLGRRRSADNVALLGVGVRVSIVCKQCLPPPLDWFHVLAVKILDTLFTWRVGDSSQFDVPDREQWVFDFDQYRNEGRVAAVKTLLVDFCEKSKRVNTHTLSALSGFLVMSSERYDSSMIRTFDLDPKIKVHHMAKILRREFGG